MCVKGGGVFCEDHVLVKKKNDTLFEAQWLCIQTDPG